MHQEVFKANIFRAIMLPVVIFGLLTLAFLGIYSVEGTIPVWVFIFYVIPAGLAIGGQVDKVIVEGDMLRYEHGFIPKKYDEISLNKVSQIEVRTVNEISQDSDGKSTIKTKKYAFVLDKSGQTYFTFDADFIRKGNRQRFEDAVTTLNPTIRVI